MKACLTSVPQPRNATTSVKPCRYFLRTGWCAFGSKCRFSHCQKPLPATEVSDAGRDGQQEAWESTACTAPPVPQTETDNRKPCWFFRRGRCHFGEKCRHRHSSVRDVTQQRRQANETCQRSEIVEQSHLSASEKEAEDVSVIDDVNHPSSSAPQTLSEVGSSVQKIDDASDKLDTLRSTEITQLRRRYPKAAVTATEDGCTVAKFVFEPSDPDWPYDVRQINISVSFPPLYPAQMLEVCLTDNDRVPPTVQNLVSESLQHWVSSQHHHSSGELIFRRMIRWFDRQVEDLFTKALQQYKRELICKASGVEFIPAVKLREIYPEAATQHSVDERSVDEVVRNEDDVPAADAGHGQLGKDGGGGGVVDKDGRGGGVVNEEERGGTVVNEEEQGGSVVNEDERGGNVVDEDGRDGTVVNEDGRGGSGVDEDGGGGGVVVDGRGGNVGGSTLRKGTEVSLVQLRLRDGAETLRATRLSMLVSCGRCRAVEELQLNAGELYTVQCAHCHSSQLVQFQAVIAHGLSSVIGFMSVDHCHPVDLVLTTSRFLVGCTACCTDAVISVSSFLMSFLYLCQ